MKLEDVKISGRAKMALRAYMEANGLPEDTTIAELAKVVKPSALRGKNIGRGTVAEVRRLFEETAPARLYVSQATKGGVNEELRRIAEGGGKVEQIISNVLSTGLTYSIIYSMEDER